jgi:hypothetical protein
MASTRTQDDLTLQLMAANYRCQEAEQARASACRELDVLRLTVAQVRPGAVGATACHWYRGSA